MEHNITADFLIHFISDNISRLEGEKTHNVSRNNTENLIELCDGNERCICFHEMRHECDYFWLLFPLLFWGGRDNSAKTEPLKNKRAKVQLRE